MEEIKKVLLSEETIKARVKEVAKQIEKDYKGKQPYFICILKGAMVFFADLIRNIDLDMEIDTMIVSSYGNGSVSSGKINIKKDVSMEIFGKDIVIVEDIVDSGNTLYNLTKKLEERKPSSLKVVTLLDKPSRREVEFNADYVGFEIGNEFIVGYGLDYQQKYRNLPYIGVVEVSD